MSNPGDPLIWPGSLRVAYTTVNDSRQYFCAYCSKTLSTVTRLRRHERQVHSINALEWCQLCPRRFSDKREFNVHDHSWPQGIYVLGRLFSCGTVWKQVWSNPLTCILARQTSPQIPSSAQTATEIRVN